MSDKNLHVQSSSLYWWNYPDLPDKLCDTDGQFSSEVKHFLQSGKIDLKAPIVNTKPSMIYFENVFI